MVRTAEHSSRQLYYFQHENQGYWLKWQSLVDEQDYQWRQQGFIRECELYRHETYHEILLPFQCIDLPAMFWNQNTAGQGLILSAAETAFPQLTASTSVQWIKDRIFLICYALQRLHQQGLIHADLKKQHFVQFQQRICLIDLEQVQQIGVKHLTLNATPRYMAPELFHAEEKSIQTDLYALGIILLEWLSGQRFTAKTYEDWAVLHCQDLKIELPTAFQCFVPLLMGLLAKQKQQRFVDLNAAKRCLMTEIE